MGKVSQDRRKDIYFKIFEQVFEDPTVAIYDISEETGISRNTISKYLYEMNERGVLVGPQIKIKPAPNYREYIYLMNFKNPFQVFEGLKNFPHVLYHVMTFGDWNIMVATNRPLDFSKLVGFETMVKQGVRGQSYTPRVEEVTWTESFKRANELLNQFTPAQNDYRERRIAPPLDWKESEWALFHAFKYNMRKKATPTLHKIKVRYELYAKWLEGLETHASIHVGFYPDGYENYMTYCFLFSSDHEDTVKSLFSCLPTTPFIVEVGDQLMVFANMISSEMTRWLFCTIYDIKGKEMIRGFSQAVAVFHCLH